MSEEEKVLKIEKGPDIEIEKGEQTEKGENAEQIAEKTKILAAKVTEKGNEFREEIKNRKPGEGIIEEFNKGEEAIEEEAKNAANLIIKGNNMENKEGINQKLSKEEISKQVEEINKRLDTGRLNIEQVNELRKQREELLNMLPEYQGDWGRGSGTEEEVIGHNDNKTIKLPDQESETKIKETTWENNPKIVNKVMELMRDPSSELSIIHKAINFEEGKIPELEFKLAELESSNQQYTREERIKFFKADIREHKKTLENLKKRSKEIVNKLEEEN